MQRLWVKLVLIFVLVIIEFCMVYRCFFGCRVVIFLLLWLMWMLFLFEVQFGFLWCFVLLKRKWQLFSLMVLLGDMCRLCWVLYWLLRIMLMVYMVMFRCVSCMFQQLWVRLWVLVSMFLCWVLLRKLWKLVRIIQVDSRNIVSIVQLKLLKYIELVVVRIVLVISIGVSMLSSQWFGVFFQCISMLIVRVVISVVISGRNMVLKYGGLIDSLVLLRVLSSSGQRVLRRIIEVVIISIRLFSSSRVLCDYRVKLIWFLIIGVCRVNRVSELLIISSRKVRMNILCFGLEVKVCIEVSMLEWIRKVFSRFREKVVIVSSMVQFLNMLCFLVIVSEWISVVLISQGMKEVFFIGFQNYQFFQFSLQQVYQELSMMLILRKVQVIRVQGCDQCVQVVFRWLLSSVVMVKVKVIENLM